MKQKAIFAFTRTIENVAQSACTRSQIASLNAATNFIRSVLSSGLIDRKGVPNAKCRLNKGQLYVKIAKENIKIYRFLLIQRKTSMNNYANYANDIIYNILRILP